MTVDPFRHHPRLRELITPAERSFFFDFHPTQMDPIMAEQGHGPDWRRSLGEIEQVRRAALSGHRGDLWVFGYGSLIWDPAIRFTEVRRARLDGYRRSFCLVDELGARGQPGAPGVLAALEEGGACDGLAFRVRAQDVEAESVRLFHREAIAPAYLPVFTPAETDHGVVDALVFVADPTADVIRPDLPWEETVRYAATGEGNIGTSFDYVANLAAHFDAFGIEDPLVSRLLADARAFRAAASSAG